MAAVLLAFGALSWSASRGTSATFDEPLHAVAAWALVRERDFRINPQDPSLWQYWVAPAHLGVTLTIDRNDPAWAGMASTIEGQWAITRKALYETPGVDGRAFLARSRAMMVLLGMVLGAVIAIWAWQLGGAIAVVAATLCYALDPSFLGHSPLVKNDVPFALVTAAAVLAVWHLGRRVTWPRAIALALLCGVLLTTKLSGLIIVPMLGLLLLVRSLLPQPWEVMGGPLRARWSRLLTVAALGAGAALVAFLLIWLVYGWRFAPGADGTRFDMAKLCDDLALFRLRAADPDYLPGAEEIRSVEPDLVTRAVRFADDHRLVPQAYLAGFQFMRANSLLRPSYLLGRISFHGWPLYFPLAMVFKAPLATLAAGALAAGALGLLAWRSRAWRSPAAVWTTLCLAGPTLAYLAIAMHSGMNLGLRYLFPIYPLIFVTIGAGAALAWRHWPRLTAVAAAVLGAALAVESLRAYPHYIAFFNAACGGSRGGFRLLGDSNLDWGQDLPALAEWQQQNPDRKLYLCYFGMAEPRAYGLRFTYAPGSANLRIGGAPSPAEDELIESGVLAISATYLQGMYLTGDESRLYAPYRRRDPLAVLNGTIYLYECEGLRP